MTHGPRFVPVKKDLPSSDFVVHYCFLPAYSVSFRHSLSFLSHLASFLSLQSLHLSLLHARRLKQTTYFFLSKTSGLDPQALPNFDRLFRRYYFSGWGLWSRFSSFD